MESYSLPSDDLKAIVASVIYEWPRPGREIQAALHRLRDLSNSVDSLTFEAIASCLGDSEDQKKVLRVFHDKVVHVMYEELPLGAEFIIRVLIDEPNRSVRIRDFPVLRGEYPVKLGQYRIDPRCDHRLSFVHSRFCLMCAPVSEWHWATVEFPGGVLITPV